MKKASLVVTAAGRGVGASGWSGQATRVGVIGGAGLSSATLRGAGENNHNATSGIQARMIHFAEEGTPEWNF